MSWSKHFSKTHQREYWYNKKTGTSTWIDPNTESVKTNKSNNNSKDNIFNNFKEKGYSTDTESVPNDSMLKESNNNQSEKKSTKDLLKLRTLRLRKRKELKEKELLDKKSKERDLLEKELDKQLKEKEFLVNELQKKLRDNIQKKELIVKKLNELNKSNSIDDVNNKTHNVILDQKKNKDVDDVINDLEKININVDKDKIEDKDKSSIEKKSIPKTSPKTSEHKSSGYSMPVESSNGMAWTIEGQSHWTREDYREALCDLNEAMRDMYR